MLLFENRGTMSKFAMTYLPATMKPILRLFFLSICLFVSAAISDAQNPEGLISYKAYAPEKVTQGDRARITYVVESTNIKLTEYPQAQGGRLVAADVKHEIVNGFIHKNTITCDYEVHCHGSMYVSPLKFIVDEKQVDLQGITLSVSPHPTYGHEWTVARNYLKTLCGYDGLDLEFKYGYTTQYAFSDEKARVFAIIVADEYQPYMADPILAYGHGHSMWNGKDNAKDNSIYAIMSRYDAQLKYLKKNNKVYHTLVPTSYKPSPKGVEPILHGVEYGQSSPYNLYFPKEKFNGRDSSCLVGCGAVALAQVMTLHKSRVQPYGRADFTLKSGKGLYAELEDYGFSWYNMQKRDTAALMFAASASIGAEMGPTATTSSLNNFEAALLCNWGYSPQAKLIEEYFDFDCLAMIYKELDNGRPVIVADEAHCFVCDGYFRDFLHYNLGWKGYCNGYYRAVVIPEADERQLPFEQMLIGVRLMERADYQSKTVVLNEPGTLSSKLSEREKQNLTELKIRGPINGADIRLIRQMAGAVYLNYYDDWQGSLMSLDLSQASIVGGDGYYTCEADGFTISGTTGGIRYSYEFPVTDREWQTILSLDLQIRESSEYWKGQDGKYYVTYVTVDDTIGSYMFADCSNLMQISLPNSSVVVSQYAFRDCRALQLARMGGAAGNVYKDAFCRASRVVFE